jgi:hypothetical protein
MHCSEVDETATGSANFWSGLGGRDRACKAVAYAVPLPWVQPGYLCACGAELFHDRVAGLGSSTRSCSA